MNRRLLAIASLVLLPLTGCGTYVNINDQFGSRQPAVYGGVVYDALWVAEEPLILLWMPVELPLSLAFDTLTLPFTIALNVSSGKWIPPEPPHTRESPRE